MRALDGVVWPRWFYAEIMRLGDASAALAGAHGSRILGGVGFGWSVRGLVLGVAGREEMRERLGQVRALNLVVNNPEADEDGLVKLAADVWGSAEVEPVCVGAQQKRFLDHLENGVDLGGTSVDDLLRSGQVMRDALLFGLEQFDRDGVGVTHLDQLQLFVLEVLLTLLLPFEFGAVALLPLDQFTHDLFADGRDAGLGELDTHPVVGNGCLDVRDKHRGLDALVCLRPVDAVEVRIDGAPTVAGVGDAESPAALTAEDRALEVVRVLLGLLAGFVAGCADGLYLLEDVGVDERRVAPLVPDSLELHEAEVVAVDEHLVDVLEADWSRRSLAGDGDAQPSTV